ncbi:DnaT-like ssDNA-binding domain-containing protein [Pseudomonas sp. GD03860]|uniref:DnaT-like ssDNA-binding domain-containing protein n=1 Tax=Pseudomonas sp. GD03860 TaxID=2975389 RepID=UPI002447B4DD|nr:DnaT-like ssDNA-binding domain-containing protein [Pseudomonas sp. GD03860]MDH0639072.1 DnaT-like ssDNA-binding domain-containing protein [Pseudomonas sp. GD03860]
MIAIRLDQSEWDLLAGEPAELLKLYCALKRRMDFSTGIAGRKTLLNELVLREGFTVDPIPGRPKQKPITRETYRSAMRRLEKLGLLVTLGVMVYQFPHARSDSPSKTATTELQPTAQPELQPEQDAPQATESAVRTNSEDEQQPGLQPHYSPSNNLLPESGNKYTAHIAHAKFAMTDAWEPDPETFTGVLFRNGMAGQTFHADQLLEFRSYWISNPDRHRTQAQWEHALAQQLKRQSRIQQAEGKRHETGGRTPGRSTRNAHDILTDQRW